MTLKIIAIALASFSLGLNVANLIFMIVNRKK